MTLQQALSEMQVRPEFLAVLEDGTVVHANRRGFLEKLWRGKPVPFKPRVMDLLRTDWKVLTAEQLAELAKQAQES